VSPRVYMAQHSASLSEGTQTLHLQARLLPHRSTHHAKDDPHGSLSLSEPALARVREGLLSKCQSCQLAAEGGHFRVRGVPRSRSLEVATALAAAAPDVLSVGVHEDVLAWNGQVGVEMTVEGRRGR
jgi:hypothetical protein